jgi:hypothetical protein
MYGPSSTLLGRTLSDISFQSKEGDTILLDVNTKKQESPPIDPSPFSKHAKRAESRNRTENHTQVSVADATP